MIKIKNNETTEITLSWLKGFFESDGCFTASFSGKYLKPVVKFSQKSNANLLPAIQLFLANYDISSKVDVPKGNTDRAPSLRIQGKNKVIKFLDLITKDDPNPFLGKTQRQLFVFMELLKNPNLTIDEKKQLLEFNRSDETNLSIRKTDSDSVKKVKNLYKAHKRLLLERIHNSSRSGTLLDDDFVSGLIDGDGSYAVGFLWKKTTSNNYRIEWKEFFKLGTDEGSYLTLESLLCHLGCKALIRPSKTKKAVSITITKRESMNTLIDLHARSPLLGHYTNARFHLVLEYRDLKESGGLKEPKKIIGFLTKYYDICGPSKGSTFKFSLEKCIKILESDRFVT